MNKSRVEYLPRSAFENVKGFLEQLQFTSRVPYIYKLLGYFVTKNTLVQILTLTTLIDPHHFDKKIRN